MSSLQILLVAILVSLLAGFGGGYGVRSYMAGKDELKAEAKVKDELLAVAKEYQAKVDARDAANLELTTKLNALDTQTTKDLNEKLTENNRLRGDLATAERMRFTGAKCPKRSTSDQASTTGSMGDGAGVELTDEARQAVFDIRDGIIKDQAKIDYLQGYVREVDLAE